MQFRNRRDSRMTRLLRVGRAYKYGQRHCSKGNKLSYHPPTKGSIGAASLMRVRPEKNVRRFYALEVEVDLFGCVLLARNWGRLGTTGRTRHDAHETVASALGALATLERTKRRRGYWGPKISVVGL